MIISFEFEIILITALIAVACAIPGVFLVLRGLSLMSDAISHSVLFGIVIGFFIISDLNSPIVLIAATLAGVLTVSLTEILINTRKVKGDAAIGLVFPFLFSIAVIMITKFADNVHLDTDAVLLGEVALAPLERIILGNLDFGPQALWIAGIIALINIIIVALFFKELKLASFDTGLSTALGFMPLWIHYGLMSMTSITAVGAFDIVGSILVVALVIASPAAAYLLTNRLSIMLLLSCGFGILSALLGYGLAYVLDVNIAGSMATTAGILFLLSLLLSPQKGLIAKFMRQSKQHVKFSIDMLLVHLLDHEGTSVQETENKRSTIHQHLRWSQLFSKRIIAQGLQQKLMEDQDGILHLTSKGKEMAQQVMSL